jgi:hypothetical protein
VNTAIGVLIGLVASAVSGVTAFWWKTRHDLGTAAAQCYDRLIKLQQAKTLPDEQKRRKIINDETLLLGPHMDLYLASLGAALLPRSRRRYWTAYERMIPILISKDLEHLEDTIDGLAPLVKARPSRDE